MQELVIGPKSVLVLHLPTMSNGKEAQRVMRDALLAAGIDLPEERVIGVGPGVDFTVIDQVTEEEISTLDMGGISDGETDGPESGPAILGYDRAPATWGYVRAAELEMQVLRDDVERWKLVASGGHGKLRLDDRLDILSIKLNGLAVKMVGEASKSAFDICGDLQVIAAFLRSHLDGPSHKGPPQGMPVHVGVDLASGPDKSAEWTPPPLNESHKKGGG